MKYNRAFDINALAVDLLKVDGFIESILGTRTSDIKSDKMLKKERVAWRLTKGEIKQLDDWFAKITKAHQIPTVYLPKLIADTSKGIVWVGEPYK